MGENGLATAHGGGPLPGSGQAAAAGQAVPAGQVRPAGQATPAGGAPRSGQPWTDADYEQILAAAREGETDIDRVAARIGRTPHPTLAKARRLLPVGERSAPADRVLKLLRGHQQDPEYDWQRVTLEEPPPRPVVQPPALTGLPGLTPADLLAIGYAVGTAASAVDDDVVTRVGQELQRRGLLGELVRYRTDRLLGQPGAEITWGQAREAADDWLSRAFPALHYRGELWGYEDQYEDQYEDEQYEYVEGRDW